MDGWQGFIFRGVNVEKPLKLVFFLYLKYPRMGRGRWGIPYP